MKTNLHACFGIVFCLPLMIWMQREVWSHSLADTLPLLVGVPLFFWLGSPWELRNDPPRIKGRFVALGVIGMLLGLAGNVTFVFAAAWTFLLWTMFQTYVKHSAKRRLGQLMLFPLLSLPWVMLDGQLLGWMFRLSGAWTTELLLAPFQTELIREGTMILVSNIQISVEEGCSGLKSLQAMLLVGAVMAYFLLGDNGRFWWHPPIVVGIAWLANTIRVLSTTLIAVYASPEFAQGVFHDWEGVAVLTLTFLLCGVAFRQLQRDEPTSVLETSGT